MSRLSASTRSKLMLVVFGTRAWRAPLTAVPGTPLRIPSSSRSRSAPTRAASPAIFSDARRAATPIPTIAGTFSVPARRFRSCLPPVRSGCIRVPRLIHSAPAPFGPLNLCDESDSRSTPSARTSTGIFPVDCTASECINAPRECAIADSSAMGCTVPISLLACMTETSAVSSVMSSRTRSGDTIPEWSTGTSVVRQPRRARALSVFRTASCSMALAMR